MNFWNLIVNLSFSTFITLIAFIGLITWDDCIRSPLDSNVHGSCPKPLYDLGYLGFRALPGYHSLQGYILDTMKLSTTMAVFFCYIAWMIHLLIFPVITSLIGVSVYSFQRSAPNMQTQVEALQNDKLEADAKKEKFQQLVKKYKRENQKLKGLLVSQTRQMEEEKKRNESKSSKKPRGRPKGSGKNQKKARESQLQISQTYQSQNQPNLQPFNLQNLNQQQFQSQAQPYQQQQLQESQDFQSFHQLPETQQQEIIQQQLQHHHYQHHHQQQQQPMTFSNQRRQPRFTQNQHEQQQQSHQGQIRQQQRRSNQEDQ